jgi:hypothetical protein
LQTGDAGEASKKKSAQKKQKVSFFTFIMAPYSCVDDVVLYTLEWLLIDKNLRLCIMPGNLF